MQTPPQQFNPDAQEAPQVAQLLLFVLRSTQVLPQHDPGEQHTPPQSLEPAGHPPQLAPRQMPPSGQATHAPAQHFIPDPQAFPQTPQLLLSVSRLAHVLLQHDAGEQQPPPQQFNPGEQIFPHVPQFFGSTLVLAQ
jgi:hypothetical protein